MNKAVNNRVLGGFSAGIGSLAAILLSRSLGLSDIQDVSDLLVLGAFAGVCGLLAWFFVKGVLFLLGVRSEVPRFRQ